MGDASQTGNANKSRFRSQVIIEGQNPPQFGIEDLPQIERFSILYTHAPDDSGLLEVPNGQLTCRSLEELLSYLESDLVDALWFDDTISTQERTYITGWARIFRPSVSAQLLQRKVAN